MKESKKIFVPLTLDSSTKQLFSGKQLFGMLIFVILLVTLQGFMLKLGEYLPVWAVILIDLAGIYFLTFLLRKIVLQENKLMKQYQLHQNLQKTDLSFIWDIFKV